MEPFKNRVDEAAVHRIAAALGDPPGLVERACAGLDALELKARIAHVARAVREAVPGTMATLGPRLVAASRELGMWETWPLCSVVELYGQDDFDASFATMHDLTSTASCEFAVRPFLRDDEDRALAVLRGWTTDPDEHVRRLVSEGSRPRLPWGERLRSFAADPTPTLDLLERLRHDPSEYVRLSVSNHLGDIAKDHPDLANAVGRRWWGEGTDELRRIVRHGLRGRIKAGDPETLAILGYGPARVDVRRFEVGPARLDYPGVLTITVELVPRADQPLLVDYAVHHVKADGRTRPKVFKWTTAEVRRGRAWTRTKRHRIKPISTRRYYPGEHSVELLINGASFGTRPFGLVMPSPDGGGSSG